MKLPAELELYFWDVSLDEIDLHKHRSFIITRILNEGDQRAVTWLYYPNPLLDRFITCSSMPGLKLASLKDIGTMKLIALSHRGSAKDFIDLYKLNENGLDLESLIRLTPSKFPGTKINYYHIIKSLSYFDDAEAEPMPRMHADLNWADLKYFFLKEQSRLLEKIDQFDPGP